MRQPILYSGDRGQRSGDLLSTWTIGDYSVQEGREWEIIKYNKLFINYWCYIHGL